MVILEAALVVGTVGLVVYATILLVMRSQDERLPVSGAGHWRTAHYDVDGVTRVVVQKVSPSGVDVLDEHVVAAVSVDDPEYDAVFLAAMTTARERRALFEAEEE